LMEDDLVTSLTRQVKEEVIENYLLERRLIELQIEQLNTQASQIRRHAWFAGLRLTRLASLTIKPDMQSRLQEILRLDVGCFWVACLNVKFKEKCG